MTQITADKNSFFLVLSVYICVICAGWGQISNLSSKTRKLACWGQISNLSPYSLSPVLLIRIDSY